MTIEIAALRGATFRAQAEDGCDITKNFDLDIGGVDELIGIGGSLNEANLLGLVDDFTVPGDTGEVVAEDGVEDSGIVKLEGVSEALLEVGNGLAIGTDVRLHVAS